MKLHPLPLPGHLRIDTAPVADQRGRFVRLYCDRSFDGLHFPQVNLSTTFRCGTVRGMHYQLPPAAEAKLIRCLRGRVFDVAVDLRAGSPTFLQWHGVELDGEGDSQVFIPEGFAHGFQALTDDVQLLYFHTAAWSPEHERSLRHDDPRLGIRWPLPVGEVSDKDARAGLLQNDFQGIQA